MRLLAAFVLAIGLTVSMAAPASAQQAFDLSVLNPQVRDAVIAARAAEARAMAAVTQARAAAQQGERAGERARSGASGTYVEEITWGDPARTARYETEIRDNNRNGYGVQTFTAGPWVGDRFAGQYANGMKNGYGVLVYASNPNNRSGVNRYEGEWANGYGNGVGVTSWHNGKRHAGTVGTDLANGPGVIYLADGGRLEGQFTQDALSGLGVYWDAQGNVISQGIWTNNNLTTPLSR